MATPKILLTGATGYVGGTTLDHLVKSNEPSLSNLTFDLLVRGEEPAKKLKEAYGDRVNAIQWQGLTDISFIEETAAKYDIIINTGSGFIPDGAKAFVTGLARRLEQGEPASWLLHISGCTNLGDLPLTGQGFPDRVWDDADGGAVYEFLKSEDAQRPYFQRTTEVGVLTAAQTTGVQAVSLNTPLIFGEGTGLFNKQGVILPVVMQYVVRHGYGFKLSDACNFDWVYVEDLADAYVNLVRTILTREDRGVGYLPSGNKGILFPATGRVLLNEIMQRSLDAAFATGVLPREGTPATKEIREVPLKEVADECAAGFLDMAEMGWAGNKAMTGTQLKKLVGWNPKYLEKDFIQDFTDEMNALKDGRRGVTLESCIGQANK
ncbi:hypothetical protein GQ53DRAFT_886319 [Thozetella sp. PMI_491]|nr:hypothetical protein GQ53DRAFT_886319 [Thozetella sp. PMI_491]